MEAVPTTEKSANFYQTKGSHNNLHSLCETTLKHAYLMHLSLGNI